jgi:hypothetical protein
MVGEWLYNGQPLQTEDVEDYVGMVYLIVNKNTGKSYIGKKFFWATKKLPPLKGMKRKRTQRVESDWKKYYGSNTQLTKDLEEKGFDNVERYVLRLCKTKTECAYYELEEQVLRNVLFTEEYYNEFIGVKINGRNLRE